MPPGQPARTAAHFHRGLRGRQCSAADRSNWSPDVFTDPRRLAVHSRLVRERAQRSGTASTGGGQTGCSIRGSTLCKETDTGPSGAVATGWAMPTQPSHRLRRSPDHLQRSACGDIPFQGRRHHAHLRSHLAGVASGRAQSRQHLLQPARLLALSGRRHHAADGELVSICYRHQEWTVFGPPRQRRQPDGRRGRWQGSRGDRFLLCHHGQSATDRRRRQQGRAAGNCHLVQAAAGGICLLEPTRRSRRSGEAAQPELRRPIGRAACRACRSATTTCG